MPLGTAAPLGRIHGAGGGTERGGIRRDQAPRAPPGAGAEGEEEEAATEKERIASGAAVPEDGARRSFSKPGKSWFGS